MYNWNSSQVKLEDANYISDVCQPEDEEDVDEVPSDEDLVNIAETNKGKINLCQSEKGKSTLWKLNLTRSKDDIWDCRTW